MPNPDNADFSAVDSTAVREANQSLGSVLVFPCRPGFSGALTLSENATLASECAVGSTGAVSFVCAPTTSNGSGAFATEHNCSAVTCNGAAVEPQHVVSEPTADSNATQTPAQPYGTVLSFQCAAGHFGTTDGIVTYTCGQTKHFVLTSGNCVGKYCFACNAFCSLTDLCVCVCVCVLQPARQGGTRRPLASQTAPAASPAVSRTLSPASGELHVHRAAQGSIARRPLCHVQTALRALLQILSLVAAPQPAVTAHLDVLVWSRQNPAQTARQVDIKLALVPRNARSAIMDLTRLLVRALASMWTSACPKAPAPSTASDVSTPLAAMHASAMPGTEVKTVQTKLPIAPPPKQQPVTHSMVCASSTTTTGLGTAALAARAMRQLPGRIRAPSVPKCSTLTPMHRCQSARVH